MPKVAPRVETTAFILAGSFVAQLRPALAKSPELLAEVLGRPAIFHVLDQLAGAGVSRVVLRAAPQDEELEARIGSAYRGMSICHSREATAMGTAGALALALRRYPAALFLSVQWDSLGPVDFVSFLQWHASREYPDAVALLAGPGGGRSACMEMVGLGGEGRVSGLGEEGCTGAVHQYAGVSLLRADALQGIAPGSNAALEPDVLQPLAKAGGLGGWVGQMPTPSRDACERVMAGLPNLGRNTALRSAVFLDRDGTVIADRHYLSDPDGVALLPGAAEGLRRLEGLGLPLVLVTNQSGVGRGYFDLASVERVHGRLLDLLAEEGVTLSAIYSCPHAPEASCGCRKPLPGLILRAARELGLAPETSFVIGDKPCDVGLGLAVHAMTFFVGTGAGARQAKDEDCPPHFVVADLVEAAGIIEETLRKRSG